MKIYPSHFSKTICLVIFFSLFAQMGCRKVDLGIMSEVIDETVAQSDDFPDEISINPQVQRVIKELKKQNIKTGLSKNLANNYGLAQWDKAIINIPLRPKNGKTVQAGSDTILIIPLVEDGVNEVTSYLEARLTLLDAW